MSTDGLPVGAQFVAPHGQDGLVLSLGLALEQLLGRLDPPPEPPACTGCSAVVVNQVVSFMCHIWTHLPLMGAELARSCVDTLPHALSVQYSVLQFLGLARSPPFGHPQDAPSRLSFSKLDMTASRFEPFLLPGTL